MKFIILLCDNLPGRVRVQYSREWNNIRNWSINKEHPLQTERFSRGISCNVALPNFAYPKNSI